MTNSAYEEIGEIDGAIATRAEAEYNKLTPEQQLSAQQLLKRLAGPNAAETYTLRRADLSEIDASIHEVVRALTDARLLVTDFDTVTGHATVEVAHEALLQVRTRFHGWLVDADREFLLWRQRLSGTLFDWDRLGRDEGVLLRGALLAEAEQCAASRRELWTAPADSSISTRGTRRSYFPQPTGVS